MPRVIMHNTVSVDGSIDHFPIDLATHYKVAASLNADANLIGSGTAHKGLEMYVDQTPDEEPQDFVKPQERDKQTQPYWVIVDTQGLLMGALHVFRRFEYCRDIIVLVSAKTPQAFIEYLEERKYDYILTGQDKIDCALALQRLEQDYAIHTIMTDTGPTLNTHLLQEELIDEISLVLTPAFVGDDATRLIRGMLKSKGRVTLELIEHDVINAHNMWLHYRVVKGEN